MARIEFGRHKKNNAAADDGVSEVQPQHWNNDSHAQTGILGFDAVSKLLATGAFVISDTFQNIQAETGVTDTLDTITATDAQTNDIAIITADTGDTITVSSGVGNIVLPGGQSIVLDSTHLNYLILIYDGTNWKLPKVLGNAIVDDNNNEILVIGKVASAVNYIKISNAATATNPVLEPDGSDTNIGLTLQGKGTGIVKILSLIVTTLYDANSLAWAKIISTASAVNEFTFRNGATLNNPKIEATGTDANIGIDIIKKGTGKNLIENTHIDIAGILGLPVTAITIATGDLVATVAPITVQAESGVADILDTISGLANDDVVALFADTGDAITVNHDLGGTDSIHLRHKIDILLSEFVPLILVRKGAEWYEVSGPEITKVELALGKPADALAVADKQVTHVMDMPGKLIKVKGYVDTVSSSGLPTFSLRESSGGIDILSTALTIDANEKTSETAATPAVIKSDGTEDLIADEVVYVDGDVAGTGTLGAIITLWFENLSAE